MKIYAEYLRKYGNSAKNLGVWLDDTNGEPVWIVDFCDRNDASFTVCVFHAECEAEARRFAADLSAETGLPVH